MYTIKNSKSCMSRDGIAWSMTLYRDGVKVAIVMDEGRGGCIDVDWVDRSSGCVEVNWIDYKGQPVVLKCTHEEAKLYEFLRGQMSDGGFGDGPKQMDPDDYFAKLADEHESQKRIKRFCKTKTLFRVKGDKVGEHRVLKIPYCLKAHDFIIQKYGKDQIEEILDNNGEKVVL
jgi:hypothetical protein